MNLNIKSGDVFETDIENAVLAHCVPADKRGRGGFVAEVRLHTNVSDTDDWVEQYSKQKGKTGDLWVSYLNDNSKLHKVYNMITKDFLFYDVDLKDLKSALVTLRQQMEAHHETKVVMPAIGSGIDHADWKEVEILLLDVFKDTDIDITVYHYTPSK